MPQNSETPRAVGVSRKSCGGHFRGFATHCRAEPQDPPVRQRMNFRKGIDGKELRALRRMGMLPSPRRPI